MPNIRSAKKRVKVSARQAVTRRPRITAMRNAIKRVELAVNAKDGKAARLAFDAAEPVIAKAVAKGVVRKLTASRKVHRMAKMVKAAGAPPPQKKANRPAPVAKKSPAKKPVASKAK